jgi:IS30 family transposase
MNYRRVTYEDRLKIKAYLDVGLNQCEIACKLGFDKSTISREINRNTGGRGYRPKQAQRLSEERQDYRIEPRKMTGEIIDQIEKKLELYWSPEQISSRMKYEGLESVSTETIYRYIYRDSKKGGQLWSYLRRSRRTRKPRFPREYRRGTIKKARSIIQRPSGATNRSRLGHWERDTMLGKNRQTGILVITDRKSRFNIFKKLNRRKAVNVTEKTAKAFKDLPLKSITNDRGHEFSDHQRLEKKLGVKIYFCDPYCSQQRGTNENRIGVLRQYLPKGTDLSGLAQKDLKLIEFQINNRPMKCLDWKTPYEVMLKKSCAAFE